MAERSVYLVHEYLLRGSCAPVGPQHMVEGWGLRAKKRDPRPPVAGEATACPSGFEPAILVAAAQCVAGVRKGKKRRMIHAGRMHVSRW